jgi:hypothetical protein
MGITNIEAEVNDVQVILVRENNIKPVLVERKCWICNKPGCHRILCAANLKAEIEKGHYRVKAENHYE